MTLNAELAGLAIDAMASPVRLRRAAAAGTWADNGDFAYKPKVAVSDIAAVVQASTQGMLEQQPEGERGEGHVTIWTRAELRIADETAGTPADEIETPAGQRFKIVAVARRSRPGSHGRWGGSSMTEDEVFDRLRAYLARIDAEAALIDPAHRTLARVIRAHQAGPRPPGPYATLTLIGTRDTGELECRRYREASIDGTRRIVLETARGHEWLFRVDVFSPTPTDTCRLFALALGTAQADLDLSPLVVRRVPKAERAPRLIEQRWEGRAYFDVTLAGIAVAAILTETIDHAAASLSGDGRTVRGEVDRGEW